MPGAVGVTVSGVFNVAVTVPVRPLVAAEVVADQVNAYDWAVPVCDTDRFTLPPKQEMVLVEAAAVIGLAAVTVTVIGTLGLSQRVVGLTTDAKRVVVVVIIPAYEFEVPLCKVEVAVDELYQLKVGLVLPAERG